jgi:hypothetical protein
LLPDDHPALRYSYRSKHFGGALETKVLRLLGKRDADPRLRAAWHWLVPLAIVWAFIMAFLNFFPAQIGSTSFGALPKIQQRFANAPLDIYYEISRYFTAIMTAVLVVTLPANYAIGNMVMRELRRDARIADLALSTMPTRELLTGMWMRLMVGSRVFEVMAAVNFLNVYLAFSLLPYEHASVEPLLVMTFVAFLGAIGGRRGALSGLVTGFLNLTPKQRLTRMLRLTALHALQIVLLGVLFLVGLPLLALVVVFLAFVDYPLLYFLVGRGDFEKLVSMFRPSHLTEGIDLREWKSYRIPVV